MTPTTGGDESATREVARAVAEAAAWRVRLAEDGRESSEAFEAWLESSTLHAPAWRQVQASWDFLADHAIAPEVMRARREALDRARNVHANRTRRALLPSWRRTSRWTVLGAAAALVLLAVGIGRWNLPDTYSTALGERRTIKLDDGTTVTLDGDSVLTVSLHSGTRDLELRSGQARFDVAHDAARPFSVRVGDETVVATGTSFNVDLLDRTVLVTLLEGRVTVYDGARPTLVGRDAPPRLIATLDPGERVTSLRPVANGPPVASVARGVSLAETTAWQSGKLIFTDEPLGLVAARISRYSKSKIVVDASAAALKVSGVFDVGEAAAFIDAVQRVLPVEATGGPGVVRLARRAA